MHVVLERVLPPGELSRIRQLIARDSFVDGKATSTLLAKKNLELAAGSSSGKEAGQIVVRCLDAHDTFQMAVRPQVILPPLFSRYETGMEYPDHIDKAIIGGHRTDVSLTIFLSDPETYEGGELVVDSGEAERKYKLRAGDAIAYPSSTIHHVAQVTHGVRMAAVSWVQSWVRDPARRQILYDLGATAQYMTLMEGPYSDRLRRSYWNLIRCWADA